MNINWKSSRTLVALLLVFCFLFSPIMNISSALAADVRAGQTIPVSDTEDLLKAIEDLSTDTGGTIVLAEGMYELEAPIFISSPITFSGEKCLITAADSGIWTTGETVWDGPNPQYNGLIFVNGANKHGRLAIEGSITISSGEKCRAITLLKTGGRFFCLDHFIETC